MYKSNRSKALPLKVSLVSDTKASSSRFTHEHADASNFVPHELFRGQYSTSSGRIRERFFNSIKFSQPSGNNQLVNGSLGIVEYIFHTTTHLNYGTKNALRTDKNLVDNFNLSMLVLALICTKTNHFEFVRIPIIIDKTTIGDLLGLIPSYCHEECLRTQKYRGICRAANGIEILDRSLILTGTITKNSCKLLSGEVLVALPQAHSARECMTLAQGILKHSLVAPAFTIRKARVIQKCSSNISQNRYEMNALEKIDENGEDNHLGKEKSGGHNASRSKRRSFFTWTIKSARTA